MPTASFTAATVNPHRLFVTYRASAASRVAQSVDRALGAVRVVDFGVRGTTGTRVVTLPDSTDATAAAATLRAQSDVVSVAPVHYRHAMSTDLVIDPLSNNVDQWYLYKTELNTDAMPGAWTITQGSAGISVAIIDTGVDETNSDFAFDVRESVISGVKTVGAGLVQDTDGHGTNVAGLAAAQSNNTIGFAGVGYKTHIQAYKIFPNSTTTNPCPQADTADEVQAINDAVANGASVINLSLGAVQSSGIDAAEQAAVENAISSGVAVVAANGNEFASSPTDGVKSDYPAAYAGVIAVGASAVQDSTANNYGSITSENVASYSNSGPTLLAPGGDATGQTDTDILHWIEGYSTTTAGLAANKCTGSRGVCATLFNGTSQATPQVSGAIALMMAYHGGARSLSPATVLSLLQANSDVLPNVSSARQGAGRLNAARAVAAAHP